MPLSARQTILEAFKACLQTIQRANGYQSDVGLRVFMGEVLVLGEDDPDEIAAVVVQEDEVRFVGKKLAVRLPVQLQAQAKATLDEPWARVEAVIADIKTAVETENRDLGGRVRWQIGRESTRAMDRQEGSLIVGASITYVVPYGEAWGMP